MSTTDAINIDVRISRPLLAPKSLEGVGIIFLRRILTKHVQMLRKWLFFHFWLAHRDVIQTAYADGTTRLCDVLKLIWSWSKAA